MVNILGMLGRMLTRRAMNWGLRRGTEMIASRSGTGAAAGAAGKPARGAQKAQSKNARAAVKKARTAARMTRKLR